MVPGTKYLIVAALGVVLLVAVYAVGRRDGQTSYERDAAVEHGEAMGRASDAEKGIVDRDDDGVLDWLRGRADQ